MGYVPYVGFETYRRATVKIRLYFKRLMFIKCFVLKKKKKRGCHNTCGLVFSNVVIVVLFNYTYDVCHLYV
jgi:hypothetical protein